MLTFIKMLGLYYKTLIMYLFVVSHARSSSSLNSFHSPEELMCQGIPAGKCNQSAGSYLLMNCECQVCHPS